MKDVTMIAAVGQNLELGLNNDLIWHFKEDLKFFREQTMGKPIVMGYNTLKSLPRLLPGRLHIVLAPEDIKLSGEIIAVHSIDELLEEIEKYDEVMIIGGASVYKQMLDYSNKLILTEIEQTHEADVYFPVFNKEDWNSKVISEHEQDNIKYKHLIYTRKEK